MDKKVTIQILNGKFKTEETAGTIEKITKKDNMPDLYTIKTKSGLYYRRKNELKFK